MTKLEVVRRARPSIYTYDPYAAGYYVGTNPGAWIRGPLVDAHARQRFATGLCDAGLDTHAAYTR